jgi:hypothetical protein
MVLPEVGGGAGGGAGDDPGPETCARCTDAVAQFDAAEG